MADTEEPAVEPEYVRSEISAKFENIKGTEFTDLKRSIARDGQFVPVMLNDAGEIVDGWQRYMAILDINMGREPEDRIEPVFTHISSEREIEAVFALNLARRHMPAADRARLGLQLEQMRIDRELVKNGGTEKVKPKTNAQLAFETGTSERTINTEKRKIRNGGDEKPAAPPAPRQTLTDQLQDELFAVKTERDELLSKVNSYEERIGFMQEAEVAQEAGLSVEQTGRFISMQERLENANAELARCRANARKLQAENRTLRKQIK